MIKLLAFAVLVATGQLLFKRTAHGVANITGVGAALRHILFDPWFIAALTIYMSATFLWIFALREVPLSKAYPFMALAFVLVPVGAMLFYGETLGYRYFFGLAFVLVGITIISSGAEHQVNRSVNQAQHG